MGFKKKLGSFKKYFGSEYLEGIQLFAFLLKNVDIKYLTDQL